MRKISLRTRPYTHNFSGRHFFPPEKLYQNWSHNRIALCPRQSWILNTTLWISDILSVELGFRIPMALAGFQIPWAVFRIPKPMILDSTSKNFPNSRKRLTLNGANWKYVYVHRLTFLKVIEFVSQPFFVSPRNVPKNGCVHGRL